MDPKCHWALRHSGQFPLEVNRASYEELLRVPGIGVKSAWRILRARRACRLTWDALERIGIVMKRAQYFLLCGGRRRPGLADARETVLLNLMSKREQALYRVQTGAVQQQSLFASESPAGLLLAREELACLQLPI